jgi:hypothetical protein
MVMFRRWANVWNPASAAARGRARRVEMFLRLIPAKAERFRVLDIGGTSWSWQHLGVAFPAFCEVTLLNLAAEAGPLPAGFRSVAGDARRMPEFADQSFDLVFSNSVIEHVGTLYDQWAMAREVRRVGRGYFVQTPYRHFPIEPHFLFPGWQYLPVWLRRRLLQRWDLGWMRQETDPLRAQAEVEQVRLLDVREIKLLFPDGELWREWFGPLVKSLVIYKRPEQE